MLFPYFESLYIVSMLTTFSLNKTEAVIKSVAIYVDSLRVVYLTGPLMNWYLSTSGIARNLIYMDTLCSTSDK